jgi:signal transduction histidine kinase
LRIDLLQLELQTAREHKAAAGVLAELERVEEILDGVLRLATAEHRAFEDSAGGPMGTPSGGLRALIDPFPVLQEETERAGPAAGRAGSLILLEDSPDPAVHIACNSAELAQMVGELINNAIKYAAGARISVAVRVRPDAVAVEISDDGPGLSAEERLAATNRFWRAPEHREIRGNGLGMTIVDKLAGANGGRLLLAETSPHGLTARIEFPRAVASQGPVAPA